MNLKGKSFINTLEYSAAQLEFLLGRAKDFKAGKKDRALEGKSVGLIFFNPSLRTRVSFEVAVAQLGGTAVDLSVGSQSWTMEHREGVVMDGDKTEHVKDAARVLSRYVSAICVRSFPGLKSLAEDRTDPIIEAFRKYATVPVINMESALWHPCQALADALTIQEKIGPLKGKRVTLMWTYHPKALPASVPNSFAAIVCQLGAKLCIAYPPGFSLDRMVLDALPTQPEIFRERAPALEGARVVYAKSWGGSKFYDNWEEEKKARDEYKSWIVDRIPPESIFMHCLPVRRNVEATDSILDASAIYDEAENRLHAQKAILAELV